MSIKDLFHPEIVLCVSKISNVFDMLPEFKIAESYCQIDMLLKSCASWVDRTAAEKDEGYLQVIPYFSLIYDRCDHNGKFLDIDKICCYRRSKMASEKRLHGKKSIGFGGHINPCDGNTITESIFNCMFRELNEEVIIEDGAFGLPRFLGMIYDNSTSVGRVHLGAYFIIPVLESSTVIALDEEITEIGFRSLSSLQEESMGSTNQFESWSSIVLNKYWR